MSDREKLIDVVWKIDTMRAVGVELSECVDHLISNGVTVQKWIPVSERLPEKSGYYLTEIRKGNEMVLAYSSRHRAFNAFDEVENEFPVDVTYWMPLPEPPKECE